MHIQEYIYSIYAKNIVLILKDDLMGDTGSLQWTSLMLKTNTAKSLLSFCKLLILSRPKAVPFEQDFSDGRRYLKTDI